MDILTPKQFELKIAKIHAILEQAGATVEWNKKISDPDNPKQIRQVDIYVIKNKKTILIECRNRTKTQNVEWIEQLAGRKTSLNADYIIGVSSSGFTKGAINKAKRLGVELRDFNTLTLADVDRMLNKGKVELAYTKFDRFELYIVCPDQAIHTPHRSKALTTELGKPWPVESLVLKAAEAIDKHDIQHTWFRFEGTSKIPMYFRDRKVSRFVVQCAFHRLKVPVYLPIVDIYGTPESDHHDKEVFVQKDFEGVAEIYQSKERCNLAFDVSKIKPIRNAVFRSILVSFKEQVSSDRIFFLGPLPHVLKDINVVVRGVDPESSMYKSLTFGASVTF